MTATTTADYLLHRQPLRWTPQAKLLALTLVWDGRIRRDAALMLWDISEEEWKSWERKYRERGRDGLKATPRTANVNPGS